MPQMAPLYWELLFLFFIFSFLFTMIIMFHYINVNPKYNTKMTVKSKTINWKW